MADTKHLPVTHEQLAAALEVVRLHALSGMAVNSATGRSDDGFERAWKVFLQQDEALENLVKTFKGEND